MSNKITLVLGASTNPERYSYKATMSLQQHHHVVIPIGIQKGDIGGIDIINDRPLIEGIDTVTLYLNAEKQEDYYDYILSLKPKRIIFNPGTENPVLEKKAIENGIEPVIACTLVLLATNQY